MALPEPCLKSHFQRESDVFWFVFCSCDFADRSLVQKKQDDPRSHTNHDSRFTIHGCGNGGGTKPGAKPKAAGKLAAVGLTPFRTQLSIAPTAVSI